MRNRVIGPAIVLALAASPAAHADVIHVDDDATGADDGTSWADAFVHLQDALAVAQFGDQIWVAAGEYRPDESSSPLNPAPPTPGDRAATFQLVDFVEIYGGFDGTETTLASRAGLFEQTVLTGDLAGDDGPDFANNGENSFHVITSQFVPVARLDGFTVTGGHAQMLVFQNDRGGAGMYIRESSPHVANVTFLENIASGPVDQSNQPFGGAVFSVVFSDPTFEACTFIGNEATDGGAVDCDDEGTPRLIDCVFRDNVAYEWGGAFWALDNTPIVKGCVFENNTAAFSGGAIVGFSAAITVESCVFVGNQAGGAAAMSATELHVTNTVVSGNVSDSGPAVSASTGTFANTTIHGNTSATDVAGVSGGTLTLVNSIVWGNSGSSGAGEAAQVASGGALSIDHSCIQGWTGAFGGTGNFGDDPLFVDADGPDDVVGTADDDLRLAAGSPCIDAAANDALPADAFDLDGDGDTSEAVPVDVAGLVRRWEDVATPDVGVGSAPVVDMGAHESHGGPVCQADLGFQGPGNATLNVCGDDLTQAGGSAALQLAGASPFAPLFLFVGLTNDPTPTLGGVLVPTPALLVVTGPIADGDGLVTLPVTGIAGSGATFYLQAAFSDAGVASFTNAVQVDV